jgi:hypothetical protein
MSNTYRVDAESMNWRTNPDLNENSVESLDFLDDAESNPSNVTSEIQSLAITLRLTIIYDKYYNEDRHGGIELY